MPKLSAHLRPAALIAALALAGCVHRPVQQQAAVPPPEPAVLPTLPPAFQPGEIVGRWGFAAYHREGDRGRTAAAAKAQCDNPYVIRPGPTGGVMMHLADDAKPSELRLKGALRPVRRIARSSPSMAEFWCCAGRIRKSRADTAPRSMCAVAA